MDNALLSRVWSHLQAQIDELKEDVTVLKSKTSNSAFPTRWTGIFSDSNVLTGSALTVAVDNRAFMYMLAYQNPAASGDSFTNGFNLKSGTYTLKVYGLESAGSGILYIYIDNVYQGAMDWYGAASAVSTRSLTVEVESDGPHSLKGLVYLKNFSSSGFSMYLSFFSLIPGVD